MSNGSAFIGSRAGAFTESRAHQRKGRGFLGYALRMCHAVRKPPVFPAIYIDPVAFPANSYERSLESNRRWFNREYHRTTKDAGGAVLQTFDIAEALDTLNNPSGTYAGSPNPPFNSMSDWGASNINGTSDGTDPNLTDKSETFVRYFITGGGSTEIKWSRANEFDYGACVTDLKLIVNGENFSDLWLNRINSWFYRDSDIVPSPFPNNPLKPWAAAHLPIEDLGNATNGIDWTGYGNNNGALFRDTGQAISNPGSVGPGYGHLGGQSAANAALPASGQLFGFNTQVQGGPAASAFGAITVARAQVMFFQDTQYAIIELTDPGADGSSAGRTAVETAMAKAYIPVDMPPPSWSGNILPSGIITAPNGKKFPNTGIGIMIVNMTATAWFAGSPGTTKLP